MENLKVLIADDELGMRRGVSKVLSKFQITMPELDQQVGFSTMEAADGQEAMDQLQNNPYDLVLLDYKMPGYSGLEILEYIKANNVDVLPLMVTAYASLDVAVSATKNGAFDFLAKPFTPEELKSVIEKATRSVLAHRQAKKLAEEKRRVRFQFISVLAHELKAPLAAIESYLQIMKKHTIGDDLSKYDHIMDRSLIRIDGMRKLIFDLLDLTRIESGQKKRELTSVDLMEIVRTSIETMSAEAGKRGITLSLESPDQQSMFGDRSELEIICNNLISNAVKYNKDNGTVTVQLDKRGNEVRLQVTDTGFGMTEEEQQRLFGEFVRIKNENTKNVLGSGLGLSIVKRISALYQGSVSVESQKDVGSTFTVILNDTAIETHEEQKSSN
jgi:two-component system, sensor histidine kinase and response regulator